MAMSGNENIIYNFDNAETDDDSNSHQDVVDGIIIRNLHDDDDDNAFSPTYQLIVGNQQQLQQRRQTPSSSSSSSGSINIFRSNTTTNTNTAQLQQIQQEVQLRRQLQQQHNNGGANQYQHQHQHQHQYQHQPQQQPINISVNDDNDDEVPLKHGCYDNNWTWSKRYRSKEVVLSDPLNRTVHFHPNWSQGTAGARGKRPLNNGRFYWELDVSHRVFGTSIMFGIGTKNCRLHANSFTNMLGEDESGWGLSHKGILWHKGIALMYTKRFKENQATVIGILFDGIEGTLTYYKDGKCLGVAFRGLDKVKEPLYPIVCSTAAKTEMTLKSTRRDFVNLQDRCRAEIIKHVKNQWELSELKLPTPVTEYLAEVYNDMKPLRPVDNYDVCDF